MNSHIEYYVQETQQTYGVKKQYVQAVSNTGVQLSERELHEEGPYTLSTIYGTKNISMGMCNNSTELT